MPFGRRQHAGLQTALQCGATATRPRPPFARRSSETVYPNELLSAVNQASTVPVSVCRSFQAYACESDSLHCSHPAQVGLQ
jgi:hypothetical protein